METLFEEKESLPIAALPNFLRGISQFGKSGILYFDTVRRGGNISFFEGRIMAVHLSTTSIVKELLNRLSRGGVIPQNVADTIGVHNNSLGIGEVAHALVFHEYLSSEEFVKYYEAEVQEMLFSLLEEKNGTITFQIEHGSEFWLEDNDCPVYFDKKKQTTGMFPCQHLLDYVESMLLVEELCEEGEYLSLVDNDLESGMFFDADEKRIVSLAGVNASISNVLDSVCESRQSVLHLLLELKNSGVVSCGAQVDHSDFELSREKESQSGGGSEMLSVSLSQMDVSAEKRVFERINLYLMKPQGIEWVLRLVMPVGIITGLYYFQHVVKNMLDEFSVIF